MNIQISLIMNVESEKTWSALKNHQRIFLDIVRTILNIWGSCRYSNPGSPEKKDKDVDVRWSIL
jgi:hypothetical protein